jgi:hypothetical protein
VRRRSDSEGLLLWRWSGCGDVRYIGDIIFEECRDIEKR